MASSITSEFDALYSAVTTETEGLLSLRAGQVHGTHVAEVADLSAPLHEVIDAAREDAKDHPEHYRHATSDEFALGAAFAGFAVRRARGLRA